MKKTTVQIKVHSGTAVAAVTVHGYVLLEGIFAAHRPYGGDKRNPGWKVTHIPSGSSVGYTCDRLVEAQRRADLLAGLPVDWEKECPAVDSHMAAIREICSAQYT